MFNLVWNEYGALLWFCNVILNKTPKMHLWTFVDKVKLCQSDKNRNSPVPPKHTVFRIFSDHFTSSCMEIEKMSYLRLFLCQVNEFFSGNTNIIAILMKSFNWQLVRSKQNVKRWPSIVCYNCDRPVHRWVPEMVLSVESESLNHLSSCVRWTDEPMAWEGGSDDEEETPSRASHRNKKRRAPQQQRTWGDTNIEGHFEILVTYLESLLISPP